MSELSIPIASPTAGAIVSLPLLWSGSEIAAWIVCLLSTTAAVTTLQVTHTDLVIGPLASMAGLFLLMVGVRYIYARLRPEPRISAICGGVVAASWAGLMAGVTALAALRTDAPLIDTTLAHADELVGIDIPILVSWLARHRLISQVLETAYVSTVPLVFAGIILLGWMNREPRMWRTCFVFGGAATLCTVTSAFLPAIGSFVHYGISANILARLPAGAGRFYVATFEGYRSGALHSVDIRALEGVVTFPSFHAVMALVIIYAFNDLRWLARPIQAWGILILLSAVPIGGHYVIDLLAGVGVWATFMLLSQPGNLFRYIFSSRPPAILMPRAA